MILNRKLKKKLSLAFVWHMHQPSYKSSESGYYLMPWARLHSVKDYLDMLIVLEKFPRLKLNFNIVPSLLDTIEDYAYNDAHDLHSLLTVTSIEQMSDADKQFILDNFFDANYQNMIVHHKYYAELYKKRFSKDDIDINEFSNQEYSDIMAWFNLAWFDPIWGQYYPELLKLAEKEKDFSLEDRIRIIDIHRDIMRKIIPTYQKFLNQGRIEISTSPYYHPIMPLLNDVYVAEDDLNDYIIPEKISSMKDDLVCQLEKSIAKIEDVFGVRPKGIWPPEHAVSPDVLSVMADMGINWTISDEGILSSSIEKEFVRDFRGYLEDPSYISRVYKFKNGKKPIKIIFRDSVLPNLINFEYCRHNSSSTANDCFERIKYVQERLEKSPDKNNLLTIAMDGENCWESYPDDGHLFLETLYSFLEKDKSIETVLVSEYLDSGIKEKPLAHIHSGSWINKNFNLWIAEPTKNLAWQYLNNVRNMLLDYQKHNSLSEDVLAEAWNEIFVAESSDWYWWYGEPNESGKDEIFDYLFREHLRNVYILMNEVPPKYLDVPLSSLLGKPSRYPKKAISPDIDGLYITENQWEFAGCIEINSGPVLNTTQFVNRICFGCDDDNVYFKFDINKYVLENLKNKFFAQIYIYFQTHSALNNSSRIRVITKEEDVYPAFKEMFTHEAKITFLNTEKLPVLLSSVSKDGLWLLNLKNSIECAYKEVLEMRMPFDDLNVAKGESVDFFFVICANGISQEYVPQDILLSMVRPSVSATNPL